MRIWAVPVLLLLVSSGLCAALERRESSHFVYHLSAPGLQPRADSALSAARTRLITLLKDTLDYQPDIYIVDDLGTFDSLIGGKFPDWGAAAAIPTRKRIVLKSPFAFNLNRSLEELLPHEYSHLVLAHRTGFYSAPRWFDEGLAMMVSMEWGWSDNLAMSKAAVFHQLLTLDTIELVNRFSEGQAHVAYATSYLAVSYLYKQYGGEAVNQLLDSLARGRSVDAALLAATGSNYRDFEKEFRVYLEERFNVTSLMADTMYFWLALAFILILGGYLQFRRRRSYYKKWEEEERYQSSDFDYGNPDDPEEPDDDEPWRK
ncbi:MAG: hypothetical protein HY851_08270 [candidate division Zixibacteria bacterium]|nr:hypothetical protein [candidate division Zixibacteria bacterium]